MSTAVVSGTKLNRARRATTSLPSPPMHTADRRAGITVGIAAATWAVCWFAGTLVAQAVLDALSFGSASDTAPIGAVVAAAAAMWVTLVAGAVWVSRRYGTGSLAADLGMRFAPIDLLGVPLGVACQLVLLRLVYWPLRTIWPATFDEDRVEQTARDLVDRAHGLGMVGLTVMVVIGAPLVEELVYRGLLQGAMARRFRGGIAVVVVAAWFAIIHFRPVEYPGLFAFGLVLGAAALLTRRLGLGVVTHAAFNATALIWVVRR